MSQMYVPPESVGQVAPPAGASGSRPPLTDLQVLGVVIAASLIVLWTAGVLAVAAAIAVIVFRYLTGVTW